MHYDTDPRGNDHPPAGSHHGDLRAAGRRAAARPVPSPPPLASIQHNANKHRAKRRRLTTSVAGLAVVALSLPVALNMRGTTSVQSVVAGAGTSAPAAQVPVSQSEDPGAPVASAQDDGQDDQPSQDSSEEQVRVQITGVDGFSLAVKVLTGDDAVAAAEAAASAANETLDVEGVTVWVSGSGDERTVSALVEPNTFVEVSGSAQRLDQLIDVLRSGGIGMHGFSGLEGFEGLEGFDGLEWEKFFGEDFDPFDGPFPDHGAEGEHPFADFDHEKFELFFDIDGDEFPGFGQFFDEGDLSELDEYLKGLEDRFETGQLPRFDELFRDGEFVIPPGLFGENFQGCITVDGGDTFQFEFPEGCGASG